jgi:hypothetical protein
MIVSELVVETREWGLTVCRQVEARDLKVRTAVEDLDVLGLEVWVVKSFLAHRRVEPPARTEDIT